jgi:hypothetical protein
LGESLLADTSPHPAALDPHVDVAIAVLGMREENGEVGAGVVVDVLEFPPACTNIFPAIRSKFFCGKEWLCGPCGVVLHHWRWLPCPTSRG